MKITYLTAVSQDGFIARENGDVSWLEELDIDNSQTGLEDFFASVDGLVMGRNTYDFVFNYGTWPYEDKLSWVCTHHPLQALGGANLKVVETVEEVMHGARSHSVNHLWLVGGGKLASSFLNPNLITHLSISEMPIQLGSGIPLFSDHHLDDIEFEGQAVSDKGGFRQLEFVINAQGV